MYSDKIKAFIFYFLLGCIVLKFGLQMLNPQSGTFKGDHYTVDPPVGWIKDEEEKKWYEFKRKETYAATVDVWLAPENDVKTQAPEASFSITVRKLQQAAWIEDDFPLIVSSIKKAQYKIVDTGEIFLDDRITKWVLYEHNQYPIVNLDFYAIDDQNNLYKIQYSSFKKTFHKYRNDFEAAKESFQYTGFRIE